MKSNRKLAIAALLAASTLLIDGRIARADTASAPGAGSSTDAGEYARCLQRCTDQLLRNLQACNSACNPCTFRFLGICFTRSMDDACLANCRNAAFQAYDACIASCVEA